MIPTYLLVIYTYLLAVYRQAQLRGGGPAREPLLRRPPAHRGTPLSSLTTPRHTPPPLAQPSLSASLLTPAPPRSPRPTPPSQPLPHYTNLSPTPITPSTPPHSSLPPLHQARIRSIFSQFDEDGDGELSLEEMLAGVQVVLVVVLVVVAAVVV